MNVFTREALHVQEFTCRPRPDPIEELKAVVHGYPQGVKRLIVSFTCHTRFAIPFSKPSLRFALS